MANSERKLSLKERLESLSLEELALLRWKLKWQKQSREKQRPPDVRKPDWTTWGIMTGRGFGKTLSGANWCGLEAAQDPGSFSAVVAPTHDDTRYTCFEGETGLISVIPEVLIKDHNKNLPSLVLWNDSMIRGFSVATDESANRLRGPQHQRAWLDEFAAWRNPGEALSNLEFGLRLGDHPRMLWTTTPRPRQALKDLIKKTDVLVTGSLYENKDNLPDSFLKNILQYEGTRIGQQEIYGEIIDLEELGIVKRSDIQIWPHWKRLPKFVFIIMSIDTATTEKTIDSKTHDPDFSAASVWGVFHQKNSISKLGDQTNVMLLDCWQERMGLPALIAKVSKEMKYKYGDSDAPLIRLTYLDREIKGNIGRPIDLLLIEQQGAGRQLQQMLATEDILAEEYNPGKIDKLQRLHLVSNVFAHKRVWVVESEKNLGKPKTWAEPLIGQVCSYAGEGSLDHDDLLDTATQALRIVKDRFLGPLTLSTKLPEKEYAPAEKPVNPYMM